MAESDYQLKIRQGDVTVECEIPAVYPFSIEQEHSGEQMLFNKEQLEELIDILQEAMDWYSMRAAQNTKESTG